MASLTPGVLSKLLENAGNRVTSEHRQALLQVTEIVPRLSEDTWQPTRGYFLKLSDSLHSAYVSVSDADSELIRSDKLRLGQFVYVTHFDSVSTSPVPLVRGLNPLPKRRPCVGNPVDLVSSDSLHIVLPSTKNQNCKTNNVKKMKKKGLVSGSPSKGNMNKNNGVVVEMRRLSLDSSRRVWDNSSVVQSKAKASPASSSSRFNLKSTSTSPNVCMFPFFITLCFFCS